MSWARRADLADAHLGKLTELAFDRLGDYDLIWFEGRWHPFEEMLERSLRISSGLTSLGLEAGDRVVVSMPNAPEVPILYSAIWRAGGIVTPAMFLLSESELRHVVGDSGARMVVVSADLLGKASRAVEGLDHVERIICVDPEAAGGSVPLDQLEASPPGPLVARLPGDVAALLYTGGTTGRSKGVMLSHRNLDFASRVGADFESGFGVGRELMVLPLAHSFGLIATLGTFQRADPKAWVMDRRFDPGRALALIQEHRLEVLQAVPSMIQMLLSERLEDFDLSSFRVVFSGGAPLSPETFEEFRRRVPSASIYEGYGLTENATLLTGTPLGGERVGSVGVVPPGVEIRIVDNDGKALPSGEAGEIQTRSAAVMLGYWGDEDQTAEVLKNGWLATGDVGFVDEDGYVFILDRKKELIIRGGFNVFPRDVEDRLLEHPAIRMAGVVGRPEEARGEEVVAFVVPKTGETLSAEDVVEWSRGRIGGYKYPREVYLRDSLPLTNVGKIDRKALRAELSRPHPPTGPASPRSLVSSRGAGEDAPMSIERINPETLLSPHGYSHVVVATGQKLLFTAGQVSTDTEGALVGDPGDYRTQARQAGANLYAALAAGGATGADMVRLVIYVVDPSEANRNAIYAGLAEASREAGAKPTATTLIGVSALALEGAVVELEATAILE